MSTTEDTVVLNGMTYKRVSTIPRTQQANAKSQVIQYNDPVLENIPAYTYNEHPNVKRGIRLLRLKPPHFNSSTIDCELFHVVFKDDHNPVLASDESTEEKYEALSWCWGVGPKDCAINISTGGDQYTKFQVSRELALALKYLQKPKESRLLWIDQICINQSNTQERNHQVQMMALIYSRATQVCVWLGEQDEDSNVAIRFIKDDILKFENFDAVCSKGNADRWRALLMLMQRPWFSRRWVVQEIALARRATVYCGSDEIPWNDFAVAVELFVEVETATHRLSEVMEKDDRFYHVPGWFEYVSELGASLLVSATGKIFRQYQDGETDYAPPRRGLQSLEYLVSSLFTFQATEPRDAVYALLAIARDTSPLSELPAPGDHADNETLLMKAFATFLERKPYPVDYDRPYIDVCADFVSFCIKRTRKSDPSRALDILCRPWAIPPPDKDQAASSEAWKQKDREKQKKSVPGPLCPLRPESDKWIIKVRPRAPGSTAASTQNATESHRTIAEIPRQEFQGASVEGSSIAGDSDEPTGESSASQSNEEYSQELEQVSHEWKRIGLEEEKEGKENYETEIDRRSNTKYWEQATQKADDYLSRHKRPRSTKPGVSEFILEHTPSKGSNFIRTDQDQTKLPSWVGSITRAPFALFRNPGYMAVKKMGRINADTLIGPPDYGHRNYTAAQTKHADFSSLKFKKRHDHHSLYTKGFILAEITEVGPPSQNGAIPEEWFSPELGNWKDFMKEGEKMGEPPNDFWRTLVADRGKDNRNPPYYYAKACAESVSKGGIQSGAVSTTDLIHKEQNSIIAEFCRRVQAVIWNRQLVRAEWDSTDLNGNSVRKSHLGLVAASVRTGDLICILYGCSVPVVLRKNTKVGRSSADKENFEDGIEWMRDRLRNLEQVRLRKARYKNSAWNDIQIKEIQKLTSLTNDEIRRWDKERKEDEARRRESEQKTKAAIKSTTEDWNNFKYQKKEAAGATLRTTRTMRVDSEAHKERAEKAKADDPLYYYELKGECYLHDMMEGAAMGEALYEGLPEHLFEIR
jgi:hypothetical protein